MTSRVRCTHPPLRWVPQSGQTSTACSTRWVGVIRLRAKPWRRGFRGSFFSGDCRPEEGLLPGIPVGPRRFRRDSRAPIRLCSSAMTARCSAMISSRVSRLAPFRSSSASTSLVCHNSAQTCPYFFSDFRPIHLIKSEQLQASNSKDRWPSPLLFKDGTWGRPDGAGERPPCSPPLARGDGLDQNALN